MKADSIIIQLKRLGLYNQTVLFIKTLQKLLKKIIHTNSSDFGEKTVVFVKVLFTNILNKFIFFLNFLFNFSQTVNLLIIFVKSIYNFIQVLYKNTCENVGGFLENAGQIVVDAFRLFLEFLTIKLEAISNCKIIQIINEKI